MSHFQKKWISYISKLRTLDSTVNQTKDFQAMIIFTLTYLPRSPVQSKVPIWMYFGELNWKSQYLVCAVPTWGFGNTAIFSRRRRRLVSAKVAIKFWLFSFMKCLYCFFIFNTTAYNLGWFDLYLILLKSSINDLIAPLRLQWRQNTLGIGGLGRYNY